jgi:hypothetical protein
MRACGHASAGSVRGELGGQASSHGRPVATCLHHSKQQAGRQRDGMLAASWARISTETGLTAPAHDYPLYLPA